ncbi:MAG: type II secretion system F family protein [Candidatus Micrarchaeota archaeon]
MVNESLFEYAGRFFFSRNRVRRLEKELSTAGVDLPAEAFAGYAAINILVVAFFITLILMAFEPVRQTLVSLMNGALPFELPVVIIALLLLIVMLIIVYLATMVLMSTYLIMKAENRRNVLEESLPDFLTLVASNIKAGMTLDQAMWYSAKPEFGLLSEDVRHVIKGSFSGESLEISLDKLAKRFDSKVFNRTILLLKQATATGGELTEVLERTADDVRNTIIMKKEIAASLIMYEIFVLFASAIGTPFLFAVATKLIQVFENISPHLPSSSNVGGGAFGAASTFTLSGPIITSADFLYFALPTMFVTALISSFIISVIRTGTKSQGLKYFPFLLVASYLIYWFTDNVLTSFFSMFM